MIMHTPVVNKEKWGEEKEVTEKERERENERTNERTNDFFIN